MGGVDRVCDSRGVARTHEEGRTGCKPVLVRRRVRHHSTPSPCSREREDVILHGVLPATVRKPVRHIRPIPTTRLLEERVDLFHDAPETILDVGAALVLENALNFSDQIETSNRTQGGATGEAADKRKIVA